MKKKDVGITLKEEPSIMQNMAVAANKEKFLLAFNLDEGGVPEKAFEIEPEIMSEIISLLFRCGIEFEHKNGVDIGFGKAEDEDAE